MTTINLKDFYSWYTQDEYMEVSDEVAEELRANKRYEAAYRRRVTRNKGVTLDAVSDSVLRGLANMRSYLKENW